MKKILLLYVEAGLGHRKVAEAIAEELRSRSSGDLAVESKDALQYTNPFFRKTYPLFYYSLVMFAPWLWGLFYFATDVPWIYSAISPLRTLWNRLQSAPLRKFIKDQKFDFIMFTHFFPAEVCAAAKRKGLIQSTLITVVTDVIPHSVWNNPGTDLYWVMADESADLLRKRGVRDSQIRAKGIPIARRFFQEADETQLRNKFGLKDDSFTILFTGGSFGLGPTEFILESLREAGRPVQVIVVCGNNQTLFKSLNQRRFPFPVFLFGMVDNMHEIMSVSHLLIAKPGGATTCESLAKGLPMLIMSPIPGQESNNAAWLMKHGAAFRTKSAEGVKEIVTKILNDSYLLDSVRKSISAVAKPNAGPELADFIMDGLK